MFPLHDFIIVIPVADRPRMLENCIESLRAQLIRHPYGSPTFRHVSLLIVDDSSEDENIKRHRNLVDREKAAGLNAIYFGLQEQTVLLALVPKEQESGLARIIGTFPSGTVPPHKGASVSRNLAILYLASRRQRIVAPGNLLIWFVDSDQEFNSSATGDLDRDIPFFREINTLFHEQDIEVVTGKVYGDPPVAPAVMVRGLLEDIESLLGTLATADFDSPCPFHALSHAGSHNASYNDLRGLFGFGANQAPHTFGCPLSSPHTALDGLKAFASILPAFFHGLHPTRGIPLSSETCEAPKPARTVYTGNYVIRWSALRFFIPFAPLRLRMAGPVLGRLLKEEIRDRFVSAPLPLFHRRVLPGQNISEFRAGLKGSEIGHNLSREFEAQLWGDVMLFSMEALISEGYPSRIPPPHSIRAVIHTTAEMIFNQYEENRRIVENKGRALLNRLEQYKEAPGTGDEDGDAMDIIRDVVQSIVAGFSKSTNQVGKVYISGPLMNRMQSFIGSYPKDLAAWMVSLDSVNLPE